MRFRALSFRQLRGDAGARWARRFQPGEARVSDWPAGVDRRIHPELPSTNAEGLRIAPDLSGPTWILALRQTAGRGRRGRAWSDPEGNFAGSLVMHPDEPPETVALRSFVAALALREALIAAGVPSARLSLKWPNDVLLDGGKVAGILLESSGIGGAVSALVIGIGVNLAQCPPTDPNAVAAPVAVATTTGIEIGPEAFLDLLAPAYQRLESQFVTHGFAPIRRLWLAHAARLGEEIVARTGRETLSGRMGGVDAEGNLVLETAQGRRAIPAADVYF